ncbi:HAD-like protein [Auriculariales sp. MPI-PUGE-AT-0066]|nr:HAD-like protein [Auriculariales sp. MPI-PUGE-AT-0066]
MPPQTKFALFDLDGLLIDTETIYTEATNEVLAPYGCEMTYEIKAGLMGKSEMQATAHLFSSLPPISLTPEEFNRRRRALQEQRWPNTSLLPGVARLVEHLHSNQIPIAIATGSSRAAYLLKTAHLQHVFKLFDGRVVCADDPQMIGRETKPAPDLFIEAAKLLGVELPNEGARGIAFEDAILGVLAGTAAGLKVVWVPDERLERVVASSSGDGEFVVPEGIHRYATLLAFDPEAFGLPRFAQ